MNSTFSAAFFSCLLLLCTEVKIRKIIQVMEMKEKLVHRALGHEQKLEMQTHDVFTLTIYSNYYSKK